MFAQDKIHACASYQVITLNVDIVMFFSPKNSNIILDSQPNSVTTEHTHLNPQCFFCLFFVFENTVYLILRSSILCVNWHFFALSICYLPPHMTIAYVNQSAFVLLVPEGVPPIRPLFLNIL